MTTLTSHKAAPRFEPIPALLGVSHKSRACVNKLKPEVVRIARLLQNEGDVGVNGDGDDENSPEVDQSLVSLGDVDDGEGPALHDGHLLLPDLLRLMLGLTDEVLHLGRLLLHRIGLRRQFKKLTSGV